MHPRMEMLTEKKLVGRSWTMSFANNKTTELWQSFMPQRKTVTNNKGTDLYSVEVYTPWFFDRFDPAAPFEKWAAIEVTDFDSVPEHLHTLVLPAGLYAVFIHRGPASEGSNTYRYIFETWLPGSGFVLDHRPYFAVMGAHYKKDDPHAEEEIWIPVTPKKDIMKLFRV